MREDWTRTDLLCLENMGRRKATARTSDQMQRFFRLFPDASWCLDLGHAWHVDPTMTEATQMLYALADRLEQLHVSTVNTSGGHESLTYGMMRAIERVLRLLPADTRVILEACIGREEIEKEMSLAAGLFGGGNGRGAPGGAQVEGLGVVVGE